MKIIEENITIEGIPVIINSRDDDTRKPLVILSHGFSGSKADFINGGYLHELAELGYYAAAIDNRFHGDRKGPKFSEIILHPSGKADLAKLRQAMKDTADDIKRLMDEFSSYKEIDINRVAMLGVSMGGFITYRAILVDERIKVGIPIISSPYWDDIPSDVPMETDKSNVAWKAISESCQPAKYADKFYPTALLMQIGDADGHYSKDKVQEFYDKVSKYYTDCPEKLRLINYPDTRHEFTREMWTQALNWLRENV